MGRLAGMVGTWLLLSGFYDAQRIALAQSQAPVGRQSGGELLEFPSFGPVPGSDDTRMGGNPGAFDGGFSSPDIGIIGGTRRVGRVPHTRRPARVAAAPSLARPSALQLPSPLPNFGISPIAPEQTEAELTSMVDDEGPPDGLTLDAAIERMMAANLDIIALRHEIPQADADILTAGLRTNPLIYFDTQFLPYTPFSPSRPGGPTQYDINITYPVDVTHKRQARIRVARTAKSVLEAQFQDVIRRQINSLCKAFIELQAARINSMAAETAVREQQKVLDQARRRAAGGGKEAVQESLDRLAVTLDKARDSLIEARDALNDAQEALAVLIGAPPEETETIMPRGSLRDKGPTAPALEELTRLALSHRPDLVAARRGIGRAQAEVALQKANRLDDVFLFYDPFTYQDLSSQKLKSATSWVVAVTVPLPIYNRNQGNIARAHCNLSQTQVELASLERRVASEVRLAEREYRSSRDLLVRTEKTTLANQHKLTVRNAKAFAEGKLNEDDYLSHLEDETEAIRGFREALIRHRRSMVDLNSAVGLRILP
ncbi:Cobalt-zinc-cadmium resistance protein CzcC precursor [Aquisphaera giovannonii]|uniref:Cobalt-zinc-cadmium resistance protein CzcC n=2 Tax=Aquisphaera giovannonii TaxID=406548 RepID=A0A5B9VZ31_9BACT|nr:Cobalt-zinc-cadmium resistance protein CzcC precursor [Aquisphaera giovannonii]